MDRVPDAFDAGEALGVDMQQSARVRELVALRRGLGLVDAPESAEAELAELLRDGRRGDARLLTDLQRGSASPTQSLDALHRTWRRPLRNPMRPGRSILEPGFAF